MKNPKQDSNGKLRRNQEEWGKGMGHRNRLPEQNAAGLNEKDNMDRYRETEGLYWGE